MVKAGSAACFDAMVSPSDSSAGFVDAVLVLNLARGVVAQTSAPGLSAAALSSLKPSAACVLCSASTTLRSEGLSGGALPSVPVVSSAWLMVAEAVASLPLPEEAPAARASNAPPDSSSSRSRERHQS